MAGVQESILVVDDEALVRQLLHQRLTREDYQCEEVGSGVELLLEITADYPDTAVIMATAVTDTNIAIHCMKQGGDEHPSCLR